MTNQLTGRSLGQGNIFTSVCQEFCSQGGSTWAGTPWGQVHLPWTRYTPRTRYTPQTQVHPPDQVLPWTRYTPQDQVHSPKPGTPPGPGTTPRPGTPPQPGTPPRSRACQEIQATSRQYTSYRNAFLSYITVTHVPIMLQLAVEYYGHDPLPKRHQLCPG